MSKRPQLSPLERALETAIMRHLRHFRKYPGGGWYALRFLVNDYRRDGYRAQQVQEAVDRLAARGEVEIMPGSSLICVRARWN